MSSAESYFQFSLLAQAAYGLLEGDKSPAAVRSKLIDINTGRFTSTQANLFLGLDENGAVITGKGYSLLHHQPDTLLNVGFSASVFQSNETGQYILAIRGTAGLFGDILAADALGIATQGIAREQAISLYRYYKQLITPA